MKIVICGSMVFSQDMQNLSKKLKVLGHRVVLPEFTEEYAALSSLEDIKRESAHDKIQHDLIKGYFHEIQKTDAILVYNQTKNSIEFYIGGNTFLEMGFAHVLGKAIFLYNPIPNMHYRDEIEAMRPIVLSGNLEALLS